MYSHTHTHTHTHIYIYIYMFIHVHTDRHTYIHKHTHSPTHTQTHTRMHAQTHTHARTNIHTHTPTNIHTNQQTHTHIHRHTYNVHTCVDTHTYHFLMRIFQYFWKILFCFVWCSFMFMYCYWHHLYIAQAFCIYLTKANNEYNTDIYSDIRVLLSNLTGSTHSSPGAWKLGNTNIIFNTTTCKPLAVFLSITSLVGLFFNSECFSK